MANLGGVLAAKRRTESLPKKVHPAMKKVFVDYERGILQSVDYERGSKYDIFYKGGQAPGSAEYLEKHGSSGFVSREQRDRGDMGTKVLPGKPDVTQEYLDSLIDDYDRWKKTGSRFVIPETDIDRRKKAMSKRYTGNAQGFSGATGGVATSKKTLLGA